MRKTSTYARKQRARGAQAGKYNGAEWLNTIARSRPYTDETPIGGWLPGTQTAATGAMLHVRSAFDSLQSGTGTEDDFDRLVIAMGVACIRATEIAGDAASNPLSPILIAGNEALRRCLNRRRKWGKWQLDAPSIAEINEAVDVYETILQASSPAQMTAAAEAHARWDQGQELETL